MFKRKSMRQADQSVLLSDMTRKRVLAKAANIFEPLEKRTLWAANPVITEFVASNSDGLKDGNGVASDWVEIQNQGDASINLAGWGLTDNANQPFKWTFPSVILNPGAFMVIIADSSTGTALTTPDSKGYFHTNFSLSADGENLSLRRPDASVASQYGPNATAYPKQYTDISYGPTRVVNNGSTLVSKNSAVKAIVPTSGVIDAANWTGLTYDDSAWKSGTLGVGFDGGGTPPTTNLTARWYAPSIGLADNSSVSNWNAQTGTGTATGTGSARPTYQSDAASRINGKQVVRFDGSNDQLKITNQSLNGLSSYSVAVVFRTTAAGAWGDQWWGNSGIVDADVGVEAYDWGIGIDNNGAIGAGVGKPDFTTYSQGGLNDGKAHVAIFTKTGTVTALSIDGGVPIYEVGSANPRTVANITFGSINTDVNYFNGDLAEVRLYNTGLSEDAVRALASTMGTDWGITTAAGNFTPQLGLNLQSDMSNKQTTANVRIPFTVPDPSLFNTLRLNMKYDDGFVAYLNGVEVARRNTPGGAITYNSVATAGRSDAQALTAESIDLSASLGLLLGGGATNVLAFKALNASQTDSDLLVLPELIASNTVLGAGFMATPTPGAANADGFQGIVNDVTASVKHGYKDAPVNVTLTTPTVGATIVYTTDGSAPTLTNGTKILPPGGTGITSGALPTISATTVIRMAAFRDGFIASGITAESYLFVNDIVQQQERRPTLSDGSTAYWDVGMDTDVVNAYSPNAAKYNVQKALTAIPTMSLTISNDDMFGPGTLNGIYTHPMNKGEEWERDVSVEYFDPNNPDPATNQFFINAGIRVTGGVYSRATAKPKKSFKLYFRDEYGTSKLDFPIFGTDNPQKALDHLSLRGGHNFSWANDSSNYSRADFIRDQFARDTQLVLTGKAARGSFVQLYINGQYWGLYNTAEDIDQDWSAANYGGTPDDWDIIKPDDIGGVEADDGNLLAYNELFTKLDSFYGDGAISDSEYAQLSELVDMKGLVDYMMSNYYRGDADSPVISFSDGVAPRNFIALHNRTDPNGKIIFQQQDGEMSLHDKNFDRTELVGDLNPARLFNRLRTNAEFKQLVSDEVQRLFYNDGPLTVAANKARYQARVNQIDVAIIGESARWGNANRTTVTTREGNWLPEVNNGILTEFMDYRTNFVLGLLTADFPLLSTSAPNAQLNGVASNGGTAAVGSAISLSDPNAGTIYYTTDGSDPRLTGGALSPTANAYAGPITLNRALTINARVLKNGVWSAVRVLPFTVTPPTLRLSELMYNPNAFGTGFDKEEYEFLELVNTGTTTLDLSGMQLLVGIEGTIANGVTLAPGARGVLVKNAAAFQYRYGTFPQILGVYTGALANGSEQVRLYDPVSGTDVFNVTYSDAWYTATDGGGKTLVVSSLNANQGVATATGLALNSKAAWQESAVAGGTPGGDEADPAPRVVGVYADSTAWAASFKDYLATHGMGQHGFSLPGTAGRALPWRNVNVLRFAFDRPFTTGTAQAALAAIGINTVNYSPASVVASQGTTSGVTQYFATFTFGTPLTTDKLRFTLDDIALRGLGGKALDGESAASFPTGNGTAGGDTVLRVNLLPGDVDGNGLILSNDVLTARSLQLTDTSAPNYNPYADFDGNGLILSDDVLFARGRQLTGLPDGEPGGIARSGTAARGGTVSSTGIAAKTVSTGSGASGTPGTAGTGASIVGTNAATSGLTIGTGRSFKLGPFATGNLIGTVGGSVWSSTFDDDATAGAARSLLF